MGKISCLRSELNLNVCQIQQFTAENFLFPIEVVLKNGFL